MTIVVIWQEHGFQWCAADTRLVADPGDRPRTEIATKVYAIPVVVRALDPVLREPHYWTQYGFAYNGSALSASMTAATASTLLQNLACEGGRTNPPTFEEIAEFMCRLAKRFMADRRQLGNDGVFSVAFFGWCPHGSSYKVAQIDGRDDAGSLRVELTYPSPPPADGEPWLVFGSGAEAFWSTLAKYRQTEKHVTARVPRRVIDKMVADGVHQSVGGATSIGIAHKNGFELCYAVEPIQVGQPSARRVFNGLDLDTEIGRIGRYFVAGMGLA